MKTIVVSAALCLLISLNVAEAVIIHRLEFERDTWHELAREFKNDWSQLYQSEMECYARH